LEESLRLFERLLESPQFKNVPVLLIFNKAACLKEKLKRISFSKYFPDFKGFFLSFFFFFFFYFFFSFIFIYLFFLSLNIKYYIQNNNRREWIWTCFRIYSQDVLSKRKKKRIFVIPLFCWHFRFSSNTTIFETSLSKSYWKLHWYPKGESKLELLFIYFSVNLFSLYSNKKKIIVF